jgi:lysine 2,3-aminomutase
VRTIRIHSRVPVADPARITPELIAALDGEKPVWLAVHVNHARELSAAARAACTRLAKSGVPLIGQTVLLKGVNDDAATMEALLRAMVETRIKPYYLHHLDLAPGTGHFRTSIETGQALMKALRGRVSGLCQPEYVLDIPGGHGKAPIGPVYREGGIVEDWQGGQHTYID